jgi:hypothetical protein
MLTKSIFFITLPPFNRSCFFACYVFRFMHRSLLLHNTAWTALIASLYQSEASCGAAVESVPHPPRHATFSPPKPGNIGPYDRIRREAIYGGIAFGQ